MEATAEMITLPVAILNHGNTVKFTEYSFLANLLAMRGYMVVSIQHDLETDGPMITQAGEEYVGRRPHYNRGIANIWFVIDENEEVPAECRLPSFDRGGAFQWRRYHDVFRQAPSRADQEGRDARQSARPLRH
jgi:hypothetical protein